MDNELTDQAIQKLLVAVGAEPGVTSADFDTPVEDLDLDSLARTELAFRIKDLTGIDIEERIAPTTTPNAMRRMVLDDLSSRAQP